MYPREKDRLKDTIACFRDEPLCGYGYLRPSFSSRVFPQIVGGYLRIRRISHIAWSVTTTKLEQSRRRPKRKQINKVRGLTKENKNSERRNNVANCDQNVKTINCRFNL